MITNIVTTNLRIPEVDMTLVRTIAASRGISVNDYIKQAIKLTTVKDQLGALEIAPQKTVYDLLFKLANRKRTKSKIKFELSDEDKVIYET
jgi:hypothetical protein